MPADLGRARPVVNRAVGLFDASLYPQGLSDQDLDSMRYFGLRAALAASHRFAEPTARALLRSFQDLAEGQMARLQRAGIRGYVALGVHPSCVPRRGLGEVLAELPAFFRGGSVVALGAIGLQRGGPEEEEAFVEQLSLARQLNLPVLVHTPAQDKERVTRRALTLLRQAGLAPARVLVERANGRTIRPILECGHYAGLTVHPDELPAARAAALVEKLGAQRLVVGSSAGEGAGDILALAHLASLLGKRRLSSKVVARACSTNAAEFLRLAPT